MKHTIACVVLIAVTHPACAQLRAKTDEQGVAVHDGEQLVLFYQKAPKSKDGKYTRNHYFHPVNNLDGETLTEDFPADHLHQRGIFWAWHQVTIAGKPICDPWALKDAIWDVREVKASESDSGLTLRMTVDWASPAWKDAQGKEKPYLRERTDVLIHPAKGDLRVIDFTIRLLALEPELRIGGAESPMRGYGGFSPRFKLPKDIGFTSDKGVVEPTLDQLEAGPWMDVAATFGDKGLSGAAILVHPKNPGNTKTWILRRRGSMQNAVWPGATPVLISKDDPTVLRYRLVLHRGKVDGATIEGWQSDYAKIALRDGREERSLAAVSRFDGRADFDTVGGEASATLIDLDKTAVDDQALSELSGLTSARKIYFNGSKITDAGFAALVPLQRLLTLDVRNTKTGDAGLGALAKLPELHTFYANGTLISDAGIPAIGSLTTLRILNLRDTRVTDAGLPELTKLKHLETLNLTGNKITDQGLRSLAPLGQLQTLYLNFTPITDTGAQHLLAFPKLQTLNVRGTKITDEGLKTIAKLPEIQNLYLNSIALTDAGCKEIAKLSKLKYLVLEVTPITDQGLSELASLRELEWLDLNGTRVTKDGVNSFRKKMPKCEVGGP